MPSLKPPPPPYDVHAFRRLSGASQDIQCTYQSHFVMFQQLQQRQAGDTGCFREYGFTVVLFLRNFLKKKVASFFRITRYLAEKALLNS